MYGSRGAMLGSGGVSDGYKVGSKRQRMMDSNPYFAVSSSTGGFQPYGFGGGFQPPPLPVVRLRGLPFNCTDINNFKFFAGLDIVDVNLSTSMEGSRERVLLCLLESCRLSLLYREINIPYGVNMWKFSGVRGRIITMAGVHYEGIYDNDYHGSPPPSRSKRFNDKDQMEYTEILKMRGLPFSAKESDIIDFFKDFTLVEEGMHIACRPDGKATGEGYVEFVSMEEAKRAMSKDKMTIGFRFVELFPSTPDEARRAESRSRQ